MSYHSQKNSAKNVIPVDAIPDDEAWFAKFFMGSIAAIVLATLLLPVLSSIRLTPTSNIRQIASTISTIVK